MHMHTTTYSFSSMSKFFGQNVLGLDQRKHSFSVWTSCLLASVFVLSICICSQHEDNIIGSSSLQLYVLYEYKSYCPFH
jgi:hypothetical protein